MIKLIKRYLSYLGKVPLCNKNKCKAPQVFGYCFILCWRCLGLLSGGVMGSLLYNMNILNQKNNMFFISILSMPFLIDIVVQFVSKNKSTNIRRVLTGVLFGIALTNFRCLISNWVMMSSFHNKNRL